MFLLKIIYLFTTATWALAVPTPGSSDAYLSGFGEMSALVPRELTGLELARSLNGSVYSIESLERRGFLSHETGLEKRQQANFNYALGTLAIAGYINTYAAPTVDSIQSTCFSKGASGDRTCLGDGIRVVADTVVLAVLAYTTYAQRVVGLLQASYNVLNQFAAPTTRKDFEAPTPHVGEIDSVASQPCPNNNQYAQNFGGLSEHFSGTNGFKIACKRSCGNLDSSSVRQTANSLYNSAVQNMLNRGALNMQFSLYHTITNNVVARCAVQLETVSTNTCGFVITGDSCQFQ